MAKKVAEVDAEVTQFKADVAANQEETRKQLATVQEMIDRNKIDSDKQIAEVLQLLKSLQPPTTAAASLPPTSGVASQLPPPTSFATQIPPSISLATHHSSPYSNFPGLRFDAQGCPLPTWVSRGASTLRPQVSNEDVFQNFSEFPGGISSGVFTPPVSTIPTGTNFDRGWEIKEQLAKRRDLMMEDTKDKTCDVEESDIDSRKSEETKKTILIMHKGMDNDDEQCGVDPYVSITGEGKRKASNEHHLHSIFVGELPYSNDYPQTTKDITNQAVNRKVIKLVFQEGKHGKENKGRVDKSWLTNIKNSLGLNIEFNLSFEEPTGDILHLYNHIDYYTRLKKGIQRRVWDPGITRCNILKQHLEDKVFFRGGVMIRIISLLGYIRFIIFNSLFRDINIRKLLLVSSLIRQVLGKKLSNSINRTSSL